MRKVLKFYDLQEYWIELRRSDFGAAGVYVVHARSGNYFETMKLLVQ